LEGDLNEDVKLFGLEVLEGDLGGVFPFLFVMGCDGVVFIGEVVFLGPLNEGLGVLVFPKNAALAYPLVHRLGGGGREVSVLFSVEGEPVENGVVMEEVFNTGGGEVKFHCFYLFCMNE
jgi:hypothetical protein